MRMCTYTTCQERTLCMFYTCQEQTSNQERTHSMPAVGFNFSFPLVIVENPGNDPKIMGILSLLLALKLFIESFYT